MSLAEELQLPKKSLKEFKVVTTQILNYIPNVINEEKIYNNYVLCSSNIAGTRKQIRPFNKELFNFFTVRFTNCLIEYWTPVAIT